MTKGILDIVCGGQFGSEGKGAVGAWLASNTDCKVAVRVAGPNAGHSAIDPRTGTKWALRQIPVAAVVDYELQIVIGAGSEVDENVLADEIERLEAGGVPVLERLHIDRSATLLTNDHIAQEQVVKMGGNLTDRLGSTAKGIGAARADRVWRSAQTWGEVSDHADLVPVRGVDTVALLRKALADGDRVMLEGTQGYGLGLHTEHYPKCTSSDCRAVDFAAMAGITPWTDAGTVNNWVVLRTYPIRVAGNSGSLKNETSWKQLGLASGGYIGEEKTTVTQKVRRVGGWDPDLAREAVEANGGASAQVALTFFDYLYPELAGASSPKDLTTEQVRHVWAIEHQIGTAIQLLGTGPDTAIWLGNCAA